MCVTEGAVTQMCQEHVAEIIARFYAKHPGIREFIADRKRVNGCRHCIEMDLNDEYGDGVGNEWRFGIEWLES